MTFTKIVFSSDDYTQSTDGNVASLTALSSLDLTATARAFVDVNGNLKIRGVANNQNTTSAFYIKTYGLYVKNSAGTEMLFAVATTQNSNFVPAYNNKQTNQIAYTFNLAISSTSNITLSNQSDVDVTQADIASINSAVNNNTSNISNLFNNAFQFLGNVSGNNLSSLTKDGIYNLAGQTYTDSPHDGPLYGTILQNGRGVGVQSQLIFENVGRMFFRMINGWGTEGWFEVSKDSDITALQNSLSANISSNSSAISSLSSSASSASSAIASNASSIASLGSTANDAWTMGYQAASDGFNFHGSLNGTVDVSNYRNGVSNGWWSLSSVTINGLSGFSGYGIMSRSSDIYNITSNSGSQTANFVSIQVIDSVNKNIYYNVFSFTIWSGWKQVATADTTLQFQGAVPGNTLSQVVTPGIYDLQGRSFSDYTNNIWGQLTVVVTGGVVNQTIRNNTGNMWIQSVNGWGISGWKQVV